MNRSFHIKLKHYLVFGLSCIILVTSLILLLFPTISYTKLYEDQTKNYCKNFTLQIATDLTNSLEQYENKIDDLVDNVTLRSFFYPESQFNNSIYKYNHLISDIFKKDSLDGYYLEELDCYIIDTNQSLSFGSKPTNLKNIKATSYYYSSLLAPTTLNWIGYNKNSDSIEISRIIYNYENYHPIGLLIIRLSKSFFTDILEKYDRENIEQIYIINNKGALLAPSYFTKSPIHSSDIQLLSSSDTSGINDSSKEWLIYTKLGDTAAKYPYDKWSVAVNVKKSTILKSYQDIEILFMLTAATITIIGIFITAKFSEKVTMPIERLERAMTAIQDGNLDISLAITSHIDEITDMYHGFNQMTIKLNLLINTVYKSKIAEKESQLKALRSQINPHFLFNTLQLIGLKAHEFDADEICDMISSLSYMLESDLYNSDDENYILQDELNYINHYINIIHQKYKNKIKFIFDIETECLVCQIPKMILQPFVENAVVHGLGPKTDSGTIKISIHHEHSNLLFQIYDDGVGIHSDILRTLQNGNKSFASNSRGHHIALKNIQNRIHLLYGYKYGFTIDSQFCKGTIIKLKLPYRKEK